MRPPGEKYALLTDLYELTMGAGYLAEDMNHPATFELFVRELPDARSFLIAAGAEIALEYLESLRFVEDDLSFLRSLGMFDEGFLGFLSEMRFTGDVWALPEGEVFFPPEPLMRVTAPLIQAQIVETYLINCIGYSTSVASKAARVAIASGGRRFVDFSPRRDHGPEAAMLAARSSFIGGAAGTSNVLAGKRWGIPLSGTMAHSYVMAFPSEEEAFTAFARRFPGNAVLLIDTFDTIQGAHTAARVAARLADDEGIAVRGVRIDSGDLAESSKQVRQILDDAGHGEISIFVSGDLDEYVIEGLIRKEAPIDAFGVGTQLGTVADAPALGMVYKLVEDAQGPKLKTSPGKRTIGGRKQIYRFEVEERLVGDEVHLESSEPPEGGRPLLKQVMSGGERLDPPEGLAAMQRRCGDSLRSLPETLLTLEGKSVYPVTISPLLG